jgi:hypothetical protein
MVKHIWSVMCKRTEIDPVTNTISIHEAYESLQFSIDTPDPNYRAGLSIGIPFSFELVSLFFRDSAGKPEDLDEVLIVLDPKGQRLAELTSDVHFSEQNDRMRNIMRFENIAMTSSGTYLFQIFTQKKNQNRRQLVSAIPINIKLEVNGDSIQA